MAYNHWLITTSFAFLIVSGCDTRKLGDPKATVLLSVDLAVIRDADVIDGYLIDGKSVAMEGDGNGVGVNVTDYPVTANLGQLGHDHIEELLSVLLDPGTYEWESRKSCIVTPGVKLTFQSEGQVDLLFCFECDILLVYRDGRYVSGGNFDFGRPRVIEVLKASFTDDPVIQTLATSLP